MKKSKAMFNLTIDFGGSCIKVALLNGRDVVAQKKLVNHSKLEDISRLLFFIDQMLLDLDKKKSDLDGLGISLPGIVDTDKKFMISVNEKYAYAVNLDFRQWGMTHFGLDPVVDNDARLAILGEVGFGVAQGEKDVVMLILGTGVGTAAVIEGQVLRGRHYKAGIMGGHFALSYKEGTCNCGARGCVEMLAGGWSIERKVRSHPLYKDSCLNGGDINFYEITKACQDGDRCAKEIIEYCSDVWGYCLVNLIHAYDPETAILSGGPMKSSELFLPRMQSIVNEAWIYWGEPKIVVADEPELSVIKGLNYQLNSVWQ